MKEIFLLTGNKDKVKAANSVFKEYNISVSPLDLDIPEIQASTSVEIARDMVEKAHEKTGKPVIREDHSFFIKELGFPGPFMSYIDKTIAPEQLLKILNTLESREAYFELGAAYCDKSGNVHEFSYKVPVVMAKEIRGDDNLRWEKLMKFPGDNKTFAELDPSNYLDVWTKNYKSIAKLIQEN